MAPHIVKYSDNIFTGALVLIIIRFWLSTLMSSVGLMVKEGEATTSIMWLSDSTIDGGIDGCHKKRHLY